MTSRRLEYSLAFLVAFFAFVVYLKTLCPNVNFVDAGELATVCATLGIAHPTGYPLFTLIGWLISRLPLGLRVIYQLNLLAAFESSVALFLCFRFLVFFLNEFPRGSHRASDPESNISFIKYLPALSGTLVLAFSEIYWSQSLSIEVYPLQNIFLFLLLFSFTKALRTENTIGELYSHQHRNTLNWVVFAYILGLAFTNHMTTVLLAPGFLYLFFSMEGFTVRSWKKILIQIPFFLLGLSPYVYLILRSASNPMMNWGSPDNFDRLIIHLSGKMYRIAMFHSFETIKYQLGYFLNGLLPHFGYLPVAIACVGIWKLFQEAKTLLVFTILLFAGCLIYSLNYGIEDIDPYFIMAYVIIAIWFAFGIKYVLQKLRENAKSPVVIIAVIAVSLLPLFVNYANTNESKDTIIEEYVHDMFMSLAPNAIILSPQYDYFNSPCEYYQVVEKLRPDVIILDKNLMQRPWYIAQLPKMYPGQFVLPEAEMEQYTHDYIAVEQSLPYDTISINRQILNIIYQIIDKNYSTHPIYVTQKIEPAYTSGFRRIPSGLAFRLMRDTVWHDIPMPKFNVYIPEKKHGFTDMVLTEYAQAYANNAIYSDFLGKKARALQEINKALEILPNSEDAKAVKEQILRRR
ncbi:MAG: DUF2723 domain-containing protein [Bacteroidota bacterium]